MKKVLVIAYEFPPSGGGGVQRTLKFVKYLSVYGWQPIVLTVKNPLYPLSDETLVDEVPSDVPVKRAQEWLPNTWTQKVRGRLRSGPSKKASNDTKLRRVMAKFDARIRKQIRLLYIKAIQLAIPDQHIAWVIPAFLKARGLVKREKPEAVYLTGPPFSVFIIGYLLKWFFGIPYVVDFRDAWSLNPLLERRLKKSIIAPLEYQIIKSAAKAIFATRIMQEDYEEKYPSLAHKFSTITNGYDEADFIDVVPKKLPSISVVYMGRVTPKRKLGNFLLALKDVFAQEASWRSKIKLYFVGDVYMGHVDTIKRLGLGDVVELVGYLPHREALGYTLGADVLLLLGSGDLAEMTGKIFEYLRANRPVFAVVPRDGEAGKLLRQSGHGIVAQYDNLSEITDKLKKLLLNHPGNMRVQDGPDPIVSQFDRRCLTKRLAGVLEKVSKGS
jgi:glycosyltransferase involved in cell wall biosynthesis